MTSVVVATGDSGSSSGSPSLTSPSRTKPRVMYSSGRGGSGNIRRKLPPSPTTSTLSVPPKNPHLDRASVISDCSGNFSSSGSSVYSASTSINRPPTSPGGDAKSFKGLGRPSSSGSRMRASSLLSVPGSLSSLPVKAYLIDDTVILAQGREVTEQSPSKRSGRGGAGSYQKVIEKNSEYFDPVRHPRTAALMAEYKEAVDSRERALLQQSQLEYKKKVRMGRGGSGNMVKGNALKLPKQSRHKKSRSASLDVPRRSKVFASRFGNPDIRALAISTDNLHLTPPDNVHCEDHKHDEDEIPRLPPFKDENAGDVSAKKKRGVLGLGKMFKFKKLSKKREAENRAPKVEFGDAI